VLEGLRTGFSRAEKRTRKGGKGVGRKERKKAKIRQSYQMFNGEFGANKGPFIGCFRSPLFGPI